MEMFRSVLAFIIFLLFTKGMTEEVAFKSCGQELSIRIRRICRKNGGYNSMGQARIKRGIVNECCQNKCFDSSLYSYCRAERSGTDYEKADKKTDQDFERSSSNRRNFFSHGKVFSAYNHSFRLTYTVQNQQNTSTTTLSNNNRQRHLAKIYRNRSAEVGTLPPEYKIPVIIV